MTQMKNQAGKKVEPKRSYTRKSTYITKKQKEKQKALKYEIIAIAFLAIGLFLILSVYFNLGGYVGGLFRKILFGLFGLTAYLIPVFISLAALLKAFNKKNQRLNHKIILLVLLMISVTSFIHILSVQSSQIDIKLMDKSGFFPALIHYFSISSQSKIGGGFIGGFFGDITMLFFGKIGSMIILILIILSLLILLTEKSLFKIIKLIANKIRSVSKAAYHKGKENYESYQSNKVGQGAEKKQTNPIRGDFLKKATILQDEGELKKTVEAYENYEEDNQELNEQFLEPIKAVSNDKEPPEDNIALKIDEASDQIVIQELKEIKEAPKGSTNYSLYEFPPLQLLKDSPHQKGVGANSLSKQNAEKLEKTLESFGVQARVVHISYGPTVTRYELQPEQGVKVSRIVNLSDDIALNLAASGIRIEAPIPGKALVGIEVPNKEVGTVPIKEVVDTKEFRKFPSKIAFGLGKDISGETIIADIGKMPHLLISGSTGSGKSVCINTIIISLLYRANPNEVKLLMIDPKVVELKIYNGIPHLLIPVVTDPKKAAGALYWAVQEMSERYQLFANANVRDLKAYNKMADENEEINKIPQIVIVVDELADLMQVAAKEVEDAICRLAQMARAAGIHLILATQRPSVDVITGIIKANIPSRIAFAVSSGVDSRTIIDMNGAEKLIGKGDMLYYPVGLPKPIRVQGAFISDSEVEKVVGFLKASQKVSYDKNIIEQISKEAKSNSDKESNDSDDVDEYFEEALHLVIEREKASASMLQRKFRVGYNRAARIIEQLHEAGYIGPDEGSKPRKVLITMEEYYQLKKESKENDLLDEALASDEFFSEE